MKPKCRRCGESDQLFPDPAGYCIDAYILPPHPQAGAPLLCRWCSDPQHPSIIDAKKAKELLLFQQLLQIDL